MAITGLNNQNGTSINNCYPRTTKSVDSFKGIMSAASEKVEKQKSGAIIGFGTIIDPNTNRGWGMTAKYAISSTSTKPIVYVETNYGGKTVAYNISINEVDPENASRLEIFALASYADAQEIGCNSTFGTYNTINNFEEVAIHNGFFGADVESVSTWQQFGKEKLNWANACMRLTNLFDGCHDLRQFQDGMKLMDLFSKYPRTQQT